MTIANVKPPRAEKRPRVETWHGYEKRDDYHWLKAANWREAMHDPSLLPGDIRAFLEAENTTMNGDGGHGRPAGDAVCRDEGPHQGSRRIGSAPTVPSPIIPPM